jgi:AcrR family transcriptional regulator
VTIGPGDRAPEDLTARARIRDAALRIFADRGIDQATIREIAKAAGVSSGLVRHHFGSKEALRDACDSYAVERMNQIREQIFTEGKSHDQAFMGSVHPVAMLMQRYLARSLLDGSDAAMARFDDMVRLSEQWLTDHGIAPRDPRAYAAVLVVMQMGVFAMPEQVSRAMGADVRTPEGNARMLAAMVEIFAHPLLTPDEAAMSLGALDRVVARFPERGARDEARPDH